jgi:hypothetical protein
MGIEAASFSMMVYCDHPDARKWTECGFELHIGGSIQTRRQALRELHRCGWWSMNNYALCPHHKPRTKKKAQEVGA